MSEDHLGRLSTKRPSIADVALKAGVSPAAVSKVIRNAYGVSPGMRKRVETAIDELGFRPSVAARSMRGASFTIGFETPEISNDFFHQIVEGAAAKLAGSRYQLIVAPGLGYLSGTAVLDALVDRQVDGIIAISSDVTADWLERLGRHVPLVLIGRHEASLAYDTIAADDLVGTRLVLDHLLGLGHEKIAHLTIPSPTDRAPHAFRLAAYQDWMRERGFPPRVSLAESSEQGAYDVAEAILTSHDPPTAVFAAHDMLAIGVLHAVADLGLTADDVSVVGFDNIRLASHPLISLTTVDQFGPEIGKTAVQLLMERIRDGRHTPTHRQVAPQLRIRRSSRPAPSPRD